MLRIGTKQPPPPPAAAPPDEPQLPQDRETTQDAAPSDAEPDLAEADEAAPAGDAQHELDKVSPQTACYLGPENGPFECGHCVHFDGANACNIVQGPIDAQGCCNLFEKNEHGEASPDEASPDDAGPDLEAAGPPDIAQEPPV